MLHSTTTPPATGVSLPLVRRERRVRRWLVRLAAVTLSCAIAIGVLELFVRATGLDAPRAWEPDPELGWRHIPGAKLHWTEEGDGQVEINRLGHRDRLDRSEAKPLGGYRIAMFGDSMTEGVQVNLDQTFCYRLENKLSRPDRHVEVLNLGVNGYGPLQELLLLRREGPRLKPDLVVLNVFLDNDVADCDSRLRYSESGVPFASLVDGAFTIDASRAIQSHADYHREPVRTLRASSATYRMIRDRWQKMAAVQTSAPGGPADAVPKRYRLYQTPAQPHWDDAWATFERTLLEFAAEVNRQQARLMIVSLPAGQIVSSASWQSLLSQHPGLAGATFDLDGPERRFAELAQKHNLPLVQSVLAYRQAGPELPLFFGHNGHFTPAGHSLMTRLLQESLQQHGLVP